MPINFPNTPTVGQTYTYNQNIWTWDGTTWNTSTSAITGATGFTGATGLGLTGATGSINSVIQRTSLANEVVNTTTETTLYEFSIPGGTLSTNNAVRVTIIGEYFNNSGAGRTLTLRVKYGATTMFDDAFPSLTQSTLRRPYRWEFILSAKDSASSQNMTGITQIGNVGAATTGLGDLGAAPTVAFNVIQGSASQNSANALDFTVTVQHPVANTLLSITLLYAFVELITS
jgi:hypothetical protein